MSAQSALCLRVATFAGLDVSGVRSTWSSRLSRPLGAILVLSVSCVVGACHGSRSPATGAADACAFCDADAGSSVCPAACRSALSDDCDSVVGPYRDANAITIGALYSTEGPGAAIGLARRQSASLAVEQIDSAGGVPIANGRARPLAMIACDESRDLLRASRHLVSDLGVSAIIGPDTTQDMLDLARKLTIASGTLLMSPSALAASISDLVDQDLAWTMVPHDSDRAALMVDQVGAIERALHAQRGSGPLKLGIVFRNDALGQSTRVSLDQLSFNGAGLTDPINLNDHVRVDPYEPDAPEQSALVASYLDFSPDVIVLIGETESVSQIMAPLETSWPSDKPKPEYLVTDASKVPELLTLASRVSDLSARLRGIGVTFTDDARAAHQLFVSDYQMRRPGIDPTLSGVASSRDAVIAIGAALAANPVAVPVGSDVAAGLRTLSIGGDAIDAASPDLMARLARGDHLSAIGSEGALQ
ncbi:MAG TPA: ABC transporter substrate-binding protein, partial [Polyangiales bacterium]